MRRPILRRRSFWLAALSLATLAAVGTLFLMPAQEAEAGPAPGYCRFDEDALYSYYSAWPAYPELLVGQKIYYGCGQGGSSSWGQVTRWVTTTCIPCSDFP